MLSSSSKSYKQAITYLQDLDEVPKPKQGDRRKISSRCENEANEGSCSEWDLGDEESNHSSEDEAEEDEDEEVPTKVTGFCLDRSFVTNSSLKGNTGIKNESHETVCGENDKKYSGRLFAPDSKNLCTSSLLRLDHSLLVL
jgi:hypothetical protein